VVGKKDDGSEFQEVDNNNITWTVAEGGKLVSLFPAYGKSVVVTATAAGNVELHIKHPDIPGYVKRLYIMVEIEDAVFKLDKNFVMLQTEGQEQQAVVSCSLTNVADTNWEEKIQWENMTPEFFTMNVSGDKKFVYLVGKKVGEGSLRAIYNGVSVRACSVIVQAPKSLTIIGNIDLLPGQVETISYEVVPPDSDVIISQDYYDFVEVKHDREACTLTLKGKKDEGYTQVSLTANGIIKYLTVNTNNNYQFRLIDQASVRGRPYLPDSGVYTVRYDINPQKNNITLLDNAASRPFMKATPIPEYQTIVIEPVKAGYFELRFEADFYKGQPDKILKVPVYLYYDVINFNFKAHKAIHPTGRTYSRIDTAQNAVFLADGETLQFFADIDEDVYPNNGFEYGIYNSFAPAMTFEPVTIGKYKDLELDANVQPEAAYDPDAKRHYLWLSIADQRLISNFSYDSLKESVYAGLITINYHYPNGNKTPTNFKKTFMLYIQLYNRTRK